MWWGVYIHAYKRICLNACILRGTDMRSDQHCIFQLLHHICLDCVFGHVASPERYKCYGIHEAQEFSAFSRDHCAPRVPSEGAMCGPHQQLVGQLRRCSGSHGCGCAAPTLFPCHLQQNRKVQKSAKKSFFTFLQFFAFSHLRQACRDGYW